MAIASRLTSELSVSRDEQTGLSVRQLTSHPSIHHHPFFYVPAYSSDGEHIVFVSHRNGQPDIYKVNVKSGDILQLSERADIAEWSIHPAWRGSFLFYTAGQKGYSLDLKSFLETEVADFSAACGMRSSGMVGAAMGVTALSHCDRYWAVRVSLASGAGLIIVDLLTGSAEMVLKRAEIGHISFCPDDNNLLFVSGPLQDRVWIVRRDGSGERRLFSRQPGEWITHETWIPGTGEVAFIDWPHGVRAVKAERTKKEESEQRVIASFNAWHAACNRQGTMMVADTNFPDIGLQIFDPRPGRESRPRTVCYPGASNVGAHWGGAFPYEDGPIEVYAPQHTHPHPSFSPDGKRIVFTSDKSGFSQIYEVDVPGGV